MFQFWGSGALYLGFETCLEGIISSFVPIKGINKKLFILSCLNDFMTCSVHFNVQSEGSIS